ncbi:hypothetical protein F4777DRAFT_214252 [Nemania sp. FL0916]|nr:hypothetical protein F4777DRAFT_214252 [Nemania sp. FL0916]
MAPIRRYLRITKYSVIECRIYLDNPGLAHSWFLNPRRPILPLVIESVRPYVLPKLREERERTRNKRGTKKKKKGIKDVVVEDEFEVSIFLTETSTRHSLVTKHKHFHDTTQTKLKSNSGRLISETNDAPIDLEDPAADSAATIRLESDDEDAGGTLAAIPAIAQAAPESGSRRPKRTRGRSTDIDVSADVYADPDAGHVAVDPVNQFEVASDEDSGGHDSQHEDDGLFVESPTSESPRPPPAKRQRPAPAAGAGAGSGDEDDKKKLAMDVSYEGFSIYGRVLCLVVKRRDVSGRGQAMMENFILSTQIPAGTDAA